MLAAVIAPVAAGAQAGQQQTTEVDRLWGADRYETSLAAAKEFAARSGNAITTAVLVSGRSWTDAVTAAPLAGSLGAPVLLSRKDSVPAATKEFLRTAGITRVIVIGTDSAVSEAALGDLSGIDPDIERISAPSPSATSVAVAEAIKNPGEAADGSGATVILASAASFADALVAGTFGARVSGAASWSPDSTRVAYVSDDGLDGVFPGLWVAGANGAARRQVANGVGTFGWSSDGANIVYLLPSDTSEYWAGLLSGELWVASSDGGGQRRLAEGASFVSYWSP